VEAVYHLAARVTIRGSVQGFVDDARVNLMGTLNLLEACSKSTVRRLVFASSMAVYADTSTPAPIPEGHRTEPLSPYGISKLSAENYCRLVGTASGLEVVTLRYFNTFGPGQAFTPYVGVITIFINRLLQGQPPVVFGGGQTRDFVHVRDVAEASVLAMTRAPAGETLNVGTGSGTTVDRIAKLLCHGIDPRIRPEYADTHPGELRNSIADIGKARRLLGFEPKSRLEDHLDEIIEWHRERREAGAR
jgi:UDP-glucose 4-epimerase